MSACWFDNIMNLKKIYINTKINTCVFEYACARE